MKRSDDQWFLESGEIADERWRTFLASVKTSAAHWRLYGIEPHDTQTWVYPDEDKWLMLSVDLVRDGAVYSTLRLDFDERGMRGGWSPACLNWDEGIRAQKAEVDYLGPDGLNAAAGDPFAMGNTAAEWFECHIRTWRR